MSKSNGILLTFLSNIVGLTAMTLFMLIAHWSALLSAPRQSKETRSTVPPTPTKPLHRGSNVNNQYFFHNSEIPLKHLPALPMETLAPIIAMDVN